MRSYDEPEERSQPDTEITLGVRSILGIFFALVLICGVFFGFGYSLGRGKAAKSAALAPTQAPSQTQPSAAPLQTVVESSGASAANPENAATTLQPATTSLPAKPSADSVAPPAAPPTAQQPAATADIPAQAQPSAPSPVVASAAPTSVAPATAPTAIPAAYTAPKQASRPADIMVQIAAVARRQDANVLVAALRRIGYTPVVRTDANDHLLHVQVGPFYTRSAAQSMRAKLLSSGYNAILK